MTSHPIVKLELAVGHAAHEVNPPTRTLVLIAGLHVRRARSRTQPAMDTIQQQLVIECTTRIDIRTGFLISHSHNYIFTTENTEGTEISALLVLQVLLCALGVLCGEF